MRAANLRLPVSSGSGCAKHYPDPSSLAGLVFALSDLRNCPPLRRRGGCRRRRTPCSPRRQAPPLRAERAAAAVDGGHLGPFARLAECHALLAGEELRRPIE